MLAIVRFLGPALVPALICLAIVYFSDKRREPWPLVLFTFALGALGKVLTGYLEGRAAAWTGLDEGVSAVGRAGALLFLYAFVAPVREAAKVCATWPAFRSKYFDEPLDGIVYSSCAALGFACVENALILREHPLGWVWIFRTLLALPAHLFFAAAWGYALGRSKREKRPGPMFPLAWVVATACHALYIHIVYGRGPSALMGTIPLLLTMAIATFFALRDLQVRGDRSSRVSILLERVTAFSGSQPPSLRTVREALSTEGQPITLRWVLYGAIVTLGAMTVGLAASIAFGHWAHVDFSIVDEQDVGTIGPVALLGSGVLAAFPLSGFLIARASSLPTLLEPALASGLAIVLLLLLLGIAAPVALIFALACSPVAWGLSCAGAWIGRPDVRRG